MRLHEKFSNFLQRAFKVLFFYYFVLREYSNKSMIVKVAGRAMMSLLCSVHLLCSDEQVFFCFTVLRESSSQSYALSQIAIFVKG